MNARSRASLIAAGCLLASSIGVVPAAAAHGGQWELAEVRRATAPYHNVKKALKAGYLATEECVPGMGYHYINPDRLESLDPSAPGALIYAPVGKRGKLKLIGVEWFKADEDKNLTTDDDRPSMFGQEFDGPMAPHPGMDDEFVHYDLHAYVWTTNPDGVFTAENPEVECPAH